MTEKNAPLAAVPIVAGGAATMLAELTVLRYVPGSIRVLGYFTNFVLLAAFVGLGVGMLAARRWASRAWIAWLTPFTLAAIVALAEGGRHLRVTTRGGEVLFLEYQALTTRVPLEPFLATSYVLLALAFAPLGFWVGTTLAGERSLARYAWNLGGSLLGIATFSTLSAAGMRPATWMAVALVFAAAPLVRAPMIVRALGVVAAAAGVLGVAHGTKDAEWSPYQKISIAPIRVHPELGVVQEWQIPSLDEAHRAALVTLPESAGFTVRVNDDSYQTPLDLSDVALEKLPALEALRVQYDLPFATRPPGSVLVLGAGTGNDVAAALRAGATHVDAVEIDPAILALGKKHPEHPYDDPRVTAHVSDARSFLTEKHGPYDTVVYGLLDSHVLLSSMSNVRLDSFVFTAESFALAKTRLQPDGIMVVSHAVAAPWFVERMRATLTRAWHKPPILVSERVRHPIGFVYACGEKLKAGPPPRADAGLIEDDWPFVYLKQREIPRDYLVAMVLMAIASIALVRAAAGPRFGGFDLHFFFLGAGFLLLETRGLAVMALVLGTTWSVTSAVFAAVLVMALGSVLVASRMPSKGRLLYLVYGFLGAALVLQHVVDPSDLAALGTGARIAAGASLAALPLLASGVVFSTSLARTGEADRALASNLTGAIAGGLVEYVSMITGFRALVILAAVLYGLAWVVARRWQLRHD